ncbi:Methyltransferase type 11 [[Leptolyngbya] sp. PCC 7376]|uniref:class I SAM-dependent DNA methyltransferase n=1 Tax=[Leptolyngbya] sp. PCC 7376 TaxID=111781 RepID=UPI00029ECE4F|nr:class I SAM-dependent methyltransferase [[Leptolyngbya] sp. PCC 7376]AFY36839.1 Methyltransferase type 11 [[Leptolyngbya] sp. PCC 7376]
MSNTNVSQTNISQLEYDASSHFYDVIMNGFQMDFSLYEDLTAILKPESVLELGCGMGRLFPIFEQTANHICGVDLSDNLLTQGREFYVNRNNQDITVSFVKENMCSFQENRQYDLIVFALSVLKHLPTIADRLEALETAKKHLRQDGFIVIDHTAFLYASRPVEWTDAKDSLVEGWLPEPNILDNYQWKKSIDGDIDILEWRRLEGNKIPFQTKFTTYRYDVSELLGHIEQLGLKHETLLTEWGINGLTSKGKRFIGLVSHPENTNNPKAALLEKVKQRQEKFWSDHDLHLATHNN